jgi:CheY-like chemotaxis protein
MATRVLLADGDADTRSVVLWCLLKEGFWVDPVANGLDAAAVLDLEKPDVAIIDLALPVFDGRRLIERMRSDARLRAVPVVAIARTAPTNAVPPDVAAFLRRPFAPEAIVKTVLRTLGGYASRFWPSGFGKFRRGGTAKA